MGIIIVTDILLVGSRLGRCSSTRGEGREGGREGGERGRGAGQQGGKREHERGDREDDVPGVGGRDEGDT